LSLLELVLIQDNIERVIERTAIVTVSPIISDKVVYHIEVNFKLPISPDLSTTYHVNRRHELLSHPGRLPDYRKQIDADRQNFVRYAAGLIMHQLEPLLDRERKETAERVRKVRRNDKAFKQQKVVNKRKKNGKK
jgi:hypothetical protein